MNSVQKNTVKIQYHNANLNGPKNILFMQNIISSGWNLTQLFFWHYLRFTCSKMQYILSTNVFFLLLFFSKKKKLLILKRITDAAGVVAFAATVSPLADVQFISARDGEGGASRDSDGFDELDWTVWNRISLWLDGSESGRSVNGRTPHDRWKFPVFSVETD